MTKKVRTPPRLTRRRSTIEPKLYLYVFCEGKNTEPAYLKQFCLAWGNSLVVIQTTGPAGAPLTLVQKACAEKSRLSNIARREKNSFSSKFEVWGIFDIDDHPNIAAAKNLAFGNNISLGISNPCFELWAILHYCMQDAYIHRHAAQSKLASLMPSYNAKGEKIIDYNLLHDKYNFARSNAIRLNENRINENSPDENPSTNIYSLMDKIIENGKTRSS